MTFLEQLQSHKGGLLYLKTELYWNGLDWDKKPGRICLLLDALDPRAWDQEMIVAKTSTAKKAESRHAAGLALRDGHAAAFLLIDEAPQWIWVADKDVELL